MGQKVDPRGYRVGVTKSWPCEWFAKTKSQSAQYLVEDIKLRKFINTHFNRTGIGKIVIRRNEESGEIILFTAKPALVIGKEGKKLDEFQQIIKNKFSRTYKISVKEIRNPELSAKVMAEFACEQLEKRMPYRKVGKGLLQRVMNKGAVGIKVQIGGRLGGVDLARTEKFIDGRVPLQTLRTDIDYHYTTALTKYGILGVKVWIYKGDVYKPVSKSKLKSKKSETRAKVTKN